MKYSKLDVIGTAILLAAGLTMVLLFVFAGNGQYIGHFSIANCWLLVNGNIVDSKSVWHRLTQQPAYEETIATDWKHDFNGMFIHYNWIINLN